MMSHPKFYRSGRFWALSTVALLGTSLGVWRYVLFPDCPAQWYRLGQDLQEREAIRAMLTQSGAVLYTTHHREHEMWRRPSGLGEWTIHCEFDPESDAQQLLHAYAHFNSSVFPKIAPERDFPPLP